MTEHGFETLSGVELADELWRRREGPDEDCVVFGDGSLSLVLSCWHQGDDSVDGYLEADRGHLKETLHATGWTVPEWLPLDSGTAPYTLDRFRAYGGESSHGSNGWVALVRVDEDGGESLEWLMVSWDSNPFGRVVLDETSLTATSTSGWVWTFPRGNPREVVMTRDPDYPAPLR
ncbi:hypothetical protein [Yinghuangia seranimata]|uniref:hypothetical protein n=1 Tax=Yinghuangia seranimata TaxID=408067 RepID=UPI00248B0777|nr:hypothetical protein [Yinghuangia seranimata]MDI2125852.1 hypothetical protein [Yinghuangia seranimata]